MNQAHIQAILEGVVPVVREFCADQLKSLIKRIDAIESRSLEKGDKGADGIAGKDGRDGLDGKDGIPGERGTDGMDGAAGRDGVDGKDGAPGERGEKGDKGEPGAPGPAGKDGIDGLVGKDGAPGRDGRDASDLTVLRGMVPEVVLPAVSAALSSMKIGTGDGGRTLQLSFSIGEEVVVHDVKTAMILDQGVWKEGQFEQGDGVSWDGSFWIAQRGTSTKPGTPGSDWRMAIKRGQNGKDGRNGKDGPQGPQGLQGMPGHSLR